MTDLAGEALTAISVAKSRTALVCCAHRRDVVVKRSREDQAAPSAGWTWVGADPGYSQIPTRPLKMHPVAQFMTAVRCSPSRGPDGRGEDDRRGRGQRAEGRGQKSGVRSQESEVGGQKSEVQRPRTNGSGEHGSAAPGEEVGPRHSFASASPRQATAPGPSCFSAKLLRGWRRSQSPPGFRRHFARRNASLVKHLRISRRIRRAIAIALCASERGGSGPAPRFRSFSALAIRSRTPRSIKRGHTLGRGRKRQRRPFRYARPHLRARRK